MVENLGRHAVLLGDKLLRNFSDGVDREGEPVVLLGVGMETHLAGESLCLNSSISTSYQVVSK